MLRSLQEPAIDKTNQQLDMCGLTDHFRSNMLAVTPLKQAFDHCVFFPLKLEASSSAGIVFGGTYIGNFMVSILTEKVQV